MKKNYCKHLSALLLAVLFTFGCQKDLKESTSSTTPLGKSDNEKSEKECRLVYATISDPTFTSDYKFHYNKKGLADKWDVLNYGLFTQDYDTRGRLIKSTQTIDGEAILIWNFFYKGNKIVREVLYNGSGTEMLDEYYNYYNQKDQLVKVQSFRNDWIAKATYTPEGNLSLSELLFGGIPVYSAYFTYNNHFKNPFRAIPGIDHGFIYYTPFDFFSSKWQFASIKQLAYGENGNPIALFEYDPSQTTLQAGPKNYPASGNYFDLLSATWVPYKYEFENCGESRDNDDANSLFAVPRSTTSAKKMNSMMLFRRVPFKSIKEQVKEFREQLRDRIN